MSGVSGAAGTAGLAALGYWFPSVCVLGQWVPGLRSLPGGLCLWRGPATSAQLALTFDDGPSPEATPRTLDLLDELGMQATFFVLGSRVGNNAELISEVLRRGHGVGCHGFRHEHHLLRSPRWIRRDFDQALGALAEAGVRPRWYRPPYGQLTAATLVEARRHGLEMVLWSAWGREWVAPDADAVVARLLRRLEPGAIVLLHDNDVVGPPGKAANTRRALELLAPVLAERGLRAVGLDTLVAPAWAPSAEDGSSGPFDGLVNANRVGRP